MNKALQTIALFSIMGGAMAQGLPEQRAIVLDEDVWVTFYDLPSRRFRTIRDAFVRRDFESVSRDLDITIGFLSVEADRAVPELKPAISEVVEQMQAMRSRLFDTSLNVGQLDAVFARTHWLLSQQYLVFAMQAKDLQMYRNAGRYLFATAHHLERSVMWSDARVTKEVVSSLDSIRDMASKLQNSESPEQVMMGKPVRLAAKTLIEIGEQIDRRVRIAELLPE